MATKKSAGKTTARKPVKGFSDFEKGAVRDRYKELQVDRADWEADLLAKIAEMPAPDRAMAERIHAIIKASAPELLPKTWYGMPAYADKDGKAVCFFQPAVKFKARYSTLGFNDSAHLDDGTMWPTAYALTGLTPAVE